MTNQEILFTEIVANNIMTKEELENYINTYATLPVFLTFAEWKKRGYMVQKGEKAIIKTKLWMKSKKKIDKSKGDDPENINEHFVLVTACLFSENQVKRMEELQNEAC